MILNLSPASTARLRGWLHSIGSEFGVACLAVFLAVGATFLALETDSVVAYGDAESHLNIAKRVVDGLTPGFAQLGGIWLPLPHLLLIPFVSNDFLWRTGIAGSIVSGIAFVVSSVFIYRLTLLLTSSAAAAFVAGLVFITNPNVLYLQATPMTELLLIVFSVLSTYYIVRYLRNEQDLIALLLSAIFTFFAVLTRYEGWFLGAFIVLALVIRQLDFVSVRTPFIPWITRFTESGFARLKGTVVLFSTCAFFGVALWLLWDYIILGDPLYFTDSPYSAKSQQKGFLAVGHLPAYHDALLAFGYYFFTSAVNVGILVFVLSLIGFWLFVIDRNQSYRLSIILPFASIFVFHVLTLFIGQSIIFIPGLTPPEYGTNMFNVRYGIMMLPFAAVFFGYLLSRSNAASRGALVACLAAELLLFATGYSRVIAYVDGQDGLSSAERPPAEQWVARHYDSGLVLVDDFSRTISIVRSGIPMEQVIYVGNKPYWDESLQQPEKYARWIIMNESDAVWRALYVDENLRAGLLRHFDEVYSESGIKIYKRKQSSV